MTPKVEHCKEKRYCDWLVERYANDSLIVMILTSYGVLSRAIEYGAQSIEVIGLS